MKRLIVLYFLIFLLTGSCKKESKVAEVTYEVTLINSTTWHGSYFNENAQIVDINSAGTNWQYTFRNENQLVAAYIQAYPDGTAPNSDTRMRIYVNGSVVAEGYSTISPQLQYIFP